MGLFRVQAIDEGASTTNVRGMKALTIHQPFAHCIVHGFKPVENRGWRPPNVGERILIHAGKRKPKPNVLGSVIALIEEEQVLDEEGVAGLLRTLEDAPLGAVVGSAVVGGYVTPHGCTASAGDPAAAAVMLEAVRNSPWYTGAIGWVLSEPVAYKDPVACRGLQGLWRPDKAVLDACLAQERALGGELGEHCEGRR